ncbi:hypothetical protein TrST_g4739 [Triparma strigata]|uniref:Uncharacterized protein n=1 Tax=Triparma strigata TaxID=1606541 RepID=A0A9W7B2M2_9STRA|nr:hypothetical protein TrST_g4739 [Triparma strigata]
MKKAGEPMIAPSLEKMVRDRDPELTWGQAKQALAGMSNAPKFGGCYKMRASKEASCCAGAHIGYMCPVDCGCCVWTPMCFHHFFPSFIIGMMICNCKDSNMPGAYQITDLKGNVTGLVPIDESKGTVGCFQENVYVSAKGDDRKISFYLEK